LLLDLILLTDLADKCADIGCISDACYIFVPLKYKCLTNYVFCTSSGSCKVSSRSAYVLKELGLVSSSLHITRFQWNMLAQYLASNHHLHQTRGCYSHRHCTTICNRGQRERSMNKANITRSHCFSSKSKFPE